MIAAEELTALADRLRSVARPARSVDEVLARVEPLAEAAGRWLERDDPIRVEALRRLPGPDGQSPFAPAMWQAALEAMFAPITPQSLRQFVVEEFGDGRALEAGGAAFPRLIGQVLAGNVPAAAVQSIFCGALAGAGQIIKPAGEDRLFPELLARSIAAVDRTLGERIAVAYWPGQIAPGAEGEGAELNAALAEAADLLIVFGQGPTIDAWRGLASRPAAGPGGRSEPPRFIPHGPRTSLELIELPAEESAWPALAERIAFDVAMYDQQGCLSPQQIYLVAGRRHATRFADRLGRALSRLARDWPMRLRPLEDRLAVRRAREANRIRRLVDPEHGPWLAPPLGGKEDCFDWTILAAAGDAMQLGPGLRTVFLSLVGSMRQALAAISPAAGVIQGVAVESDQFDRWADVLRTELHIPYVCRPGWLQRPPFGWPNDNLRPLASLLLSATPGGRVGAK